MRPWEETAPADDSARLSLLAAASPQHMQLASEEVFVTDIVSFTPPGATIAQHGQRLCTHI